MFDGVASKSKGWGMNVLFAMLGKVALFGFIQALTHRCGIVARHIPPMLVTWVTPYKLIANQSWICLMHTR